MSRSRGRGPSAKPADRAVASGADVRPARPGVAPCVARLSPGLFTMFHDLGSDGSRIVRIENEGARREGPEGSIEGLQTEISVRDTPASEFAHREGVQGRP